MEFAALIPFDALATLNNLLLFLRLLKFTVAMLHVVRTLGFTRPFRIYCLFLLLQNILRLRDEIMLIVSIITNCFLKQHSATVQISERNDKPFIFVEITM